MLSVRQVSFRYPQEDQGLPPTSLEVAPGDLTLLTQQLRQIGVMRTIGAVDRVIMQSVIIEGLVIGLITWVLAIGLSFPLAVSC